jgi:hypothetical protein
MRYYVKLTTEPSYQTLWFAGGCVNECTMSPQRQAAVSLSLENALTVARMLMESHPTGRASVEITNVV